MLVYVRLTLIKSINGWSVWLFFFQLKSIRKKNSVGKLTIWLTKGVNTTGDLCFRELVSAQLRVLFFQISKANKM